MQMEKTFCCFCCTSLPLSVDVRAPVSGYCPGQVIPIQVDVDNKSNVQLNLVKIFLRKVCNLPFNIILIFNFLILNFIQFKLRKGKIYLILI